MSQPINQQDFDDLKNAIQGRKLVSIMGTGVSMQVAKPLNINGFGVASWTGLIRHGTHRCHALGLISKDDADQFNTMVDWNKVDRLIHVAEMVTKGLKDSSAGTYGQWLGDTVGKLQVGDPRLIQALAKISGLMASLCYDTLPEKVTLRASVSWNQPDLVSDIVNGKRVEVAGQEREGIIHLHGCWTDPESVVLGTGSYTAVINHAHAKAVRMLFAVGHTMMFVGCAGTFDDPNFQQFVATVSETLKETRKSHFILCLNGEIAAWQGRIPWLHPIGYGDRHEDLLPFLENLGRYGGGPPPETGGPGPAPGPGGGSSMAAEWDRATLKVDPKLAADLFTLNRRKAVEKLDEIANGKITEIGFQTRFPGEVITFVAAHLYRRGLLRTAEGDRWIIVRGPSSWEKECTRKDVKSILVAHPDFDFESNRTELTQAAEANGHSVVYPTLLGRTDDESVVQLAQPARHELIESLRIHGITESRATKLINRSNGNVSILFRYLSGTPDKPEWAKPGEIAKVKALALLGGWRADSQADIDAVGCVMGGDYHQRISDLFPIIHGREPPFTYNQNVFRPTSRYENWQILAPFLTDRDLDLFQKAAIEALRSCDPRFDLPADKRILYAAPRESQSYSKTLREGLAETLALLGAKPEALEQCSPDKVLQVIYSVISSVLGDADWKRWASLGSLVSLIAEADPDTYLKFVRSDLNRADRSAIRQLFSEVEGGVFGGFYHSGLLWSLEVLAWKPELLNRVALILAELDQLSLPENMGNRPIASLGTILLPWMPQTLASVAERKTAVEAVIRDFPEIGWKLLLELMPASFKSSGSSQRPVWRDWIPPERSEETTFPDRSEQDRIYAELALQLALKDPAKLEKLFDHLLYLPKPSFDAIVTMLKSDTVTQLPERTRLPVWQRTIQEVRHHRKFPVAGRDVPAEIIAVLDEVAVAIEPKSPEVRYQYLFNFHDHEYWESDNYNIETVKVRERRCVAIKDLKESVGLDGVLKFAGEVLFPFSVGVALGDLGIGEADRLVLPQCLQSGDKMTEFARGYVAARVEKMSLAWFEQLPLATWSSQDVGSVFSLLPFRRDVWETAEKALGENANEYWRHIDTIPFGKPEDILLSAKKLLQFGRGPSALRAVFQLVHEKSAVPADLALESVKAFLSAGTEQRQFDVHYLQEVISYLQRLSETDKLELAKIEWVLLPLLDRLDGASPKTLQQNLASDPIFFVDIIKKCYRGKGQPKPSGEETDELKKSDASRGYRLLHNWRVVPGATSKDQVDPGEFERWITEARRLSEPTGHWEVAKSWIGHVFAYAPTDPDGLTLNRAVAKILDANDNDDMRRGYRAELFNRFGAHFVSGGRPYREQQAYYEKLAKEMNAAGFANIAATLFSLAEEYGRDAERVERREDPDD